MASLVISAEWMEQIRQALGSVETSGQAWSAIDAATDFAYEAAGAIREGDSWWSPDPWRSSAASDLDVQAAQVARLRGSYDEDSSQPVGEDWRNVHRDKVLYLYNLAQVSRKAYPADSDTGPLDSVLSLASANLFAAVVSAPKLIVSKAGEIVGGIVDTAVDTGKKVVKGAASLAKEAAAGVSDAAESLIPWKIVGAAALLAGGLIVGMYYLGKSGTLKVKVP